MKHLLNTLYVTTGDSLLSLSNEAVVINVGGAEKVRVPIHTIESFLCFGNMSVTTPLIQFCGEHGISLSFYSEYGRFYGRVTGEMHGNVLLRQAQYRAQLSEENSLTLVRSILIGKLVNSKEILMRASRERADDAAANRLRDAAQRISALALMMDACQDIDSLRGLEGAAANAYFGAFDDMLKTSDSHMTFDGRNRRPPEDPVNAVLSFMYTLLKNDTQSALEGVGLDPACGFLHALRPGRPALALDLMEELRAPLCDRLTLAMINRGQLTLSDFSSLTAPVYLNDAGRKKVLTYWQKRKTEEILHPFFKEKIPIGLIPFCQAKLFAKTLRGELDVYPPFHWR